MIAFATVLLPQPDSPARPTISPGADRERDPVDGAARSVSPEPYSTTSPSISTRGSPTGRPAPATYLGRRPALMSPLLGRKHPREEPRPRRPRLPEPRVAELVDAVVDEDDREDRERDRETGEEEVPPLALQQRGVVRRPEERRPPADLVGVAEAEELERGLVEDRLDEDEREAGGDAAEHVRHQLDEDDPQRRLAGHPRRQDEVAVPAA